MALLWCECACPAAGSGFMAEDNGDKKSEVLLKCLVAVDVNVDTLPPELVASEATKPVGFCVFLVTESC